LQPVEKGIFQPGRLFRGHAFVDFFKDSFKGSNIGLSSGFEIASSPILRWVFNCTIKLPITGLRAVIQPLPS
jgi:hypothetical protein